MSASNVLMAFIFVSLLGGCSILAGGTGHWPASLLAVLVLIPVKLMNDRRKWLQWPMEFILIAGVTMITFNLVQLYFTPLPF